MGGSGGMFGTSKQKAAGAFKMSQGATEGEAGAIARQRAIANGSAPSIGQMAFNHNLDQVAQQGMAMAASQRGASNPMLAMRQAQMAANDANLQGAQQGAMMAEQERRQADTFLQQTAANQRGVQLNSAVANQQNDAAKSSRDLKSGMDAVSGGGQAAMMAMMSDEREKENIQPKSGSGNEIEKFIATLKPYEYKYKDSANGTGEKMGVMAQDLEKSDVGKTMVDTRPDGAKMVDTNKAIGVILAGMADLNKKLKKLEK